MRQPGLRNGAKALLVAGLAAFPLAGCGSSPDGGVGSTLGNLIAFNSTKAPPVKELPTRGIDVECPDVTIIEGQSSYRTYAGSDRSAAGVRHQYSFGDISRDCTATENTLTIRVGVSGYVLAGPAGGPGSFQVPIRVTIRREGTEDVLQTKTYKIGAAIPQGDSKAPFSIVTEPFSLPLVHTDASLDYAIKVGFDATPERPQKAAARRRAR